MFKRLSKSSKLALIGVILYVILPTDFVPDFVPGFGQVDDIAIAIITFLLKTLYNDIKMKNSIKKEVIDYKK